MWSCVMGGDSVLGLLFFDVHHHWRGVLGMAILGQATPGVAGVRKDVIQR